MSREDRYSKAGRYLIEGRIVVREIDEYGGTLLADVRGSGSIYTTGRDERGRWFCNCAGFGSRCAHIEALKRVTALEPRETP